MSSDMMRNSHSRAEQNRAQLVNDRISKEFYEQFTTDVTGVWLGYNNKGEGSKSLGKVMYDGKIYQVHVLSPLGLPKGRKCNLRRTKQRNFVDW